MTKTWRMTQKTLQTFINSCLKRILRTWWPNKLSNEELWRKGMQKPAEKQIPRRKKG